MRKSLMKWHSLIKTRSWDAYIFVKGKEGNLEELDDCEEEGDDDRSVFLFEKHEQDPKSGVLDFSFHFLKLTFLSIETAFAVGVVDGFQVHSQEPSFSQDSNWSRLDQQKFGFYQKNLLDSSQQTKKEIKRKELAVDIECCFWFIWS